MTKAIYLRNISCKKWTKYSERKQNASCLHRVFKK